MAGSEVPSTSDVPLGRSPRIPYIAPPEGMGAVEAPDASRFAPAAGGSVFAPEPSSFAEFGPEPGREPEIERTTFSGRSRAFAVADAGPAAPLRRAVLEFGSGEVVSIEGGGLIGRAPRRENAPSAEQFVRVVDPSRSVSKTHAEFGFDDGGLWILDRNSGNGTALLRAGDAALALVPGRRYHLTPGDTVRLGQVSFTVRH